MNQERRGWRSQGSTHRTVLILAGNHSEFLAFCRDRRIRADQAIHVKSVADVRGHRFVQVYKTGTWYISLKGQLTEIMEAIRAVDQVGVAENEVYE